MPSATAAWVTLPSLLFSARTIPSRAAEREADVFASEFLMPEPWAAPMCAEEAASLGAVRAIPTMFRTSIVAAALCHVELARVPSAAVYSEG